MSFAGMERLRPMTYTFTLMPNGQVRAVDYQPTTSLDTSNPPGKKEMQYICTFGSGQKYANRYVVIHAYDEEAARIQMQAHFGNKWSMIYTSDIGKTGMEKAGVREFNLTQLMLSEVEQDKFKEAHTPRDFNPIEGVY